MSFLGLEYEWSDFLLYVKIIGVLFCRLVDFKIVLFFWW